MHIRSLGFEFSKTYLYFGLFIAALAAFFVPQRTWAADPNLSIRDAAYAAKYVSQSVPDPIKIEAGTTKEVEFRFKNTGTATWSATGGRHISAYTVEPKYRNSEFRGANWVSGQQTALIGGVVRPGEIGTLKIQLKAPSKPGTYTERFYLAAENHTWVKGGYFFMVIEVVEKSSIAIPAAQPGTVSPAPATPSSEPSPAQPQETAYKANHFIQNIKSVQVSGGDEVKLILGFQNVGTATWNDVKLTAISPTQLAGTKLSFADSSWKSGLLVFEKKLEGEHSIAPGGVLRETVYFRAPRLKGNYDAEFTLQADGKPLDTVTVKVAVTDNAPLNYKEPFVDSSPNPDETILPDKPRLTAEPRIRVGINTNDLKALHFVSYEDDYIVYSGTREVGVLLKRKIGEFRYEGGIYSFKGGGLQFTTEDPIRLSPKNNPHAIFELMNLKRPVSFVGPGNFNEYRGAMEYRVGEIDGKLYAVNDLYFEDYVKGIAEFGRNDEIEFIKANVVAARTYAYVSLGKYSFFDVLSNTYDQLYLGAQVEEYMPRATQAVEATRGMMVSYNDTVVITPYFGNSNGNTKSWTQVWGGTHKPWLVPVKTNYDAGRRQYGHGVGMSQRDANLRAKNEGLAYDKLLKYYYSGTDLEWMYQ